MATWEDGPEYAPRERPLHFADPDVAPLEQAPVPEAAAALPRERPGFAGPSLPVAPLETLVPVPADQRDPGRPFDVVTASLTTDPAWGPPDGTARDGTRPLGPVPFVPAQAPPQLLSQPVSPGAPWPVLEQAAPGAHPAGGFPAGGYPGQAGPPVPPEPYGYPTPGTPGWFAPPPTSYGEQRPPGRVDVRRVVEVATPGLCICLALGGVVYVLAPVMLVVAVFLSTRVQVAQRAVRTGFRVAAGAVAFFAVVGLYRSVFEGDPWWHFVSLWSLLICWIMLVVLLLTVRRALSRPTPPTRDPWT